MKKLRRKKRVVKVHVGLTLDEFGSFVSLDTDGVDVDTVHALAIDLLSRTRHRAHERRDVR